MKSLIAILIYLGTFMSMFFVLSLIGTLWFNYTDVISNNGWFLVYAMFFGWWMSILPTREYYVKNQDYFTQVF